MTRPIRDVVLHRPNSRRCDGTCPVPIFISRLALEPDLGGLQRQDIEQNDEQDHEDNAVQQIAS